MFHVQCSVCGGSSINSIKCTPLVSRNGIHGKWNTMTKKCRRAKRVAVLNSFHISNPFATCTDTFCSVFRRRPHIATYIHIMHIIHDGRQSNDTKGQHQQQWKTWKKEIANINMFYTTHELLLYGIEGTQKKSKKNIVK